MENVLEAVATAQENEVTTTVRVSIYNGDTSLKFSYSEKGELSTDKAKKHVFNSLQTILDNQKRLKALGAKNNVFGMSAFKRNHIDIDIVKDDEVSTLVAGLNFTFAALEKTTDKNEAFNILFDTMHFISGNGMSLQLPEKPVKALKAA